MTNRALMVQKASRATLYGIAANGSLAVVKGIAGVLGHSQALIADAVESISDVIGSVIVLMGLRVAASEPTDRYPYGKGRAETLAALVVSLMLLGAASLIAVESVKQIRSPHETPAAFTLAVLVGVVIAKELLFRFASGVGGEVGSSAVKADAWHHRSDAITSVAAFVGISVALFGGKGYEGADDWAALAASGIIAFNAVLLFRPALGDLLDRAPDASLAVEVRKVAEGVEGVVGTDKCRVRKLGFDLYVELDVLVHEELSVRRGHEIAHRVQDEIRAAMPAVVKTLVHVEPADPSPTARDT